MKLTLTAFLCTIAILMAGCGTVPQSTSQQRSTYGVRVTRHMYSGRIDPSFMVTKRVRLDKLKRALSMLDPCDGSGWNPQLGRYYTIDNCGTRGLPDSIWIDEAHGLVRIIENKNVSYFADKEHTVFSAIIGLQFTLEDGKLIPTD